MFTSVCTDGFDYVDKLLGKEILTGSSRHSIFTNWLNRSDGFKQLEQFSDEENEVVNNDV